MFLNVIIMQFQVLEVDSEEFAKFEDKLLDVEISTVYDVIKVKLMHIPNTCESFDL